MFNLVLEFHTTPAAWSDANITPVWKNKARRCDLKNYRPVSTMSVVGKLFCTLLNNRMYPEAEVAGVLPDEQGGSRAGRSCPDQLFALCSIVSARKIRNLRTYCAFLDVRSAFDSTWRSGLWWRLHQRGVTPRRWLILRSQFACTRSRVLTPDGPTGWEECRAGGRQGCILSPLLYLLFINNLVAYIRAAVPQGVSVTPHSSVGCLMYCDYIVLIAESEVDLQRALDATQEFATACKFQFNCDRGKTESMVFLTQGEEVGAEGAMPEFHMGTTPLHAALTYKYLGVHLTPDLSWETHQQKVVAKA